MRFLASLRNRVFLACAFVAVLSIAAGTQFVTWRVSSEAEAELRRSLAEAAELLEEHLRSRYDTLTLMARLVADLPKLKAAVATGDAPTVSPLAVEYWKQVGSDVFVLRGGDGSVLASLGMAPETKLQGHSTFQRSPAGVLETVTVPITIGLESPEKLGSLTVGFFLNDALAEELAALTQSEIVLVWGKRQIASTLEPSRQMGDDLISERIALSPDGPEVVLMRSRTERLSFLDTFREGLVLSALFGVLLAVVLSYAVARTITRPLLAITETMREMTATGDLTRKIDLKGAWNDEDATVLARVFNRLTESIARFQREAASRERLSALGRMSTVIAHEVRNPLMIIKASLRSFRRPELDCDEAREAAEDIDHEVTRINRIVGDVLDFARPLQLDLNPTDLNEVCRRAAASLISEGDSPRVELELDDALPEIVTDGERLAAALTNVLLNARDAVDGRSTNGSPDIELRTERVAPDRVAISVRDRGVGIPPDQLSKIFEPYFTGKRTGTGLGLAITKNVVESLGGTVMAESSEAGGTEIRIDLFIGGQGDC